MGHNRKSILMPNLRVRYIANSADTEEMPHFVAFPLGLHSKVNVQVFRTPRIKKDIFIFTSIDRQTSTRNMSLYTESCPLSSICIVWLNLPLVNQYLFM